MFLPWYFVLWSIQRIITGLKRFFKQLFGTEVAGNGALLERISIPDMLVFSVF